MKKQAFVFGYGKHGRTMARDLKENNFRLVIVESDEHNYAAAVEDGHLNTQLIDVTDDDALQKLSIDRDDKLICIMDDEHLNVFLTLSLRSLYPDITIYSISNSTDTAQKLKMAGASRIIDLYEVSAMKIHNILKKPVATKLLDSFLTNESEISFAEMFVCEDSGLVGERSSGIDFASHGILLVGIVEARNDEFVFATHGLDHSIGTGDILVVMGKNNDLRVFGEQLKCRSVS